jgi:hypothetical protein
MGFAHQNTDYSRKDAKYAKFGFEAIYLPLRPWRLGARNSVRVVTSKPALG